MEQNQNTALFEEIPIPSAVAKLAIPTILSSLVMVIYNMADTYFVGMVNDPVQNAAVALAAPIRMRLWLWHVLCFWLLMQSIICLVWEVPV